MAQKGTYSEELENEFKHTDPNAHASGDDKKDRPPVSMYDIYHDRPQKLPVKIKTYSLQYPRYNFVGELLGPKGQTLRALQNQTGCKMAIMGRGSMRDKEKEEELRKEGGKYAHLSEELHVLVECYTELTDGYYRLAAALTELKKFVIPELTEDAYGGPGGAEMGMDGPPVRGRGGYRGGPPDRGGRGGFRGHGNGPVPAPPPGGPAGRGTPSARGARAAPPPASYEGYSSQGYGSDYESSYDEGYGQEAYYDYGAPNSGSAAGYESYSGYDYGDGWSSGEKTSAAPSRGSSRGQARSHPYSRTASGNY
ncbi:unnamed protein product [Candidula unifasciata]|uniref:KHDC4/BBP-like KH-domain type I domain-containing protein n=1 Tax=Candidula unifasciata TaxID=100452 RepID=A0A8S4A1Z1_9EUPU|nr:unnamed protein product [Candidula unifasciata]